MSSTTVTADGIVMPEFDALIEAIRNAYTAYHPHRGKHLRDEQKRRQVALENINDEVLEGRPFSAFSADQLEFLELLIAYWRELEVTVGAPGPDPDGLDREAMTQRASRNRRPAAGGPAKSLIHDKEITKMANRNIKAVPNEKTEAPEENVTPPPIAKPSDEFDLSRFKSKKTATIANVETLPTSLPVQNMAEANDYVRLHSNEEKYWSDELCFVSVPVKGSKQNTLHLIDEDLAVQFLQAKEILRFRLALATKPNDVFFLCQVPTRNKDNTWNESNLDGCEKAKTLWMQSYQPQR